MTTVTMKDDNDDVPTTTTMVGKVDDQQHDDGVVIIPNNKTNYNSKNNNNNSNSSNNKIFATMIIPPHVVEKRRRILCHYFPNCRRNDCHFYHPHNHQQAFHRNDDDNDNDDDVYGTASKTMESFSPTSSTFSIVDNDNVITDPDNKKSKKRRNKKKLLGKKMVATTTTTAPPTTVATTTINDTTTSSSFSAVVTVTTATPSSMSSFSSSSDVGGGTDEILPSSSSSSSAIQDHDTSSNHCIDMDAVVPPSTSETTSTSNENVEMENGGSFVQEDSRCVPIRKKKKFFKKKSTTKKRGSARPTIGVVDSGKSSCHGEQIPSFKPTTTTTVNPSTSIQSDTDMLPSASLASSPLSKTRKTKKAERVKSFVPPVPTEPDVVLSSSPSDTNPGSGLNLDYTTPRPGRRCNHPSTPDGDTDQETGKTTSVPSFDVSSTDIETDTTPKRRNTTGTKPSKRPTSKNGYFTDNVCTQSPDRSAVVTPESLYGTAPYQARIDHIQAGTNLMMKKQLFAPRNNDGSYRTDVIVDEAIVVDDCSPPTTKTNRPCELGSTCFNFSCPYMHLYPRNVKVRNQGPVMLSSCTHIPPPNKTRYDTSIGAGITEDDGGTVVQKDTIVTTASTEHVSMAQSVEGSVSCRTTSHEDKTNNIVITTGSDENHFNNATSPRHTVKSITKLNPFVTPFVPKQKHHPAVSNRNVDDDPAAAAVDDDTSKIMESHLSSISRNGNIQRNGKSNLSERVSPKMTQCDRDEVIVDSSNSFGTSGQESKKNDDNHKGNDCKIQEPQVKLTEEEKHEPLVISPEKYMGQEPQEDFVSFTDATMTSPPPPPPPPEGLFDRAKYRSERNARKKERRRLEREAKAAKGVIITSSVVATTTTTSVIGSVDCQQPGSCISIESSSDTTTTTTTTSPETVVDVVVQVATSSSSSSPNDDNILLSSVVRPSVDQPADDVVATTPRNGNTPRVHSDDDDTTTPLNGNTPIMPSDDPEGDAANIMNGNIQRTEQDDETTKKNTEDLAERMMQDDIRAATWTEEIESERRAVSKLLQLCVARFCRERNSNDEERRDLARNKDVSRQLIPVCGRTYRRLIGTDQTIRRHVIVKGMGKKKQGLNGLPGVIEYWDDLTGKYMVSLRTKHMKDRRAILLPPGKLEAVDIIVNKDRKTATNGITKKTKKLSSQFDCCEVFVEDIFEGNPLLMKLSSSEVAFVLNPTFFTETDIENFIREQNECFEKERLLQHECDVLCHASQQLDNSFYPFSFKRYNYNNNNMNHTATDRGDRHRLLRNRLERRRRELEQAISSSIPFNPSRDQDNHLLDVDPIRRRVDGQLLNEEDGPD